jgi:hypothetical protein
LIPITELLALTTRIEMTERQSKIITGLTGFIVGTYLYDIYKASFRPSRDDVISLHSTTSIHTQEPTKVKWANGRHSVDLQSAAQMKDWSTRYAENFTNEIRKRPIHYLFHSTPKSTFPAHRYQCQVSTRYSLLLDRVDTYTKCEDRTLKK